MHAIQLRSIRRVVVCALLAACALATSATAALRVTVRAGDTLSAIAARHGVSTSALAGVNGIANANVLSIGRSLTVPSGRGVVTTSGATGTYTVRAGDTLSAIADRFGVSIGSITRRSGITRAQVLVIGTRLRIGGGGATGQVTRVGAGSGYTVRPGDTLSSIATRFGTDAQSLARSNGIDDANLVIVGMRLRIAGGARPTTAGTTTSGGTYTVRPGDHLGSIAARFGTSAVALARANGITNPNVVIVGTRLRVPGGSSAPSSGPLTPITAATNGWGNHPSKSTVGSIMAGHAARLGVDVALVRAVGWQESGWWQGARSSTGAIGVMQLMPGTASWIGPALLGRSINPYDVSDNIEGGTAYLAYLQRQTGSRRLAIAAYYQGLGSVTTRGLLGETEAYVASVGSFLGRV